MLIKYIMNYVWLQNNTGQVNISHSVNSNAHTTPLKIHEQPNAHQFCAVDIFWNITHRLAKSPVVKFHHGLGRGFMIQRVILILINQIYIIQSESTILHENIIHTCTKLFILRSLIYS